MKTSGMQSVLPITKALADRQRLRMLLLLRDRELCVCQIIAVLGLAPSTISKHLSILGSAGLVEHRKDGRWAYYRLPDGSADATTRSALRWIDRSMRHDEAAAGDLRKLQNVLKRDPEALCRRQRKC